jgi:toxin FitB
VIVLDTNVLSELMRPSPSSAVLAWMSGQTPEDLFTPTITMAEVLFGIELLPKGKRRDPLLDEAEATFAEDFARRVLPFDEQAAKRFALIGSDTANSWSAHWRLRSTNRGNSEHP